MEARKNATPDHRVPSPPPSEEEADRDEIAICRLTLLYPGLVEQHALQMAGAGNVLREVRKKHPKEYKMATQRTAPITEQEKKKIWQWVLADPTLCDEWVLGPMRRAHRDGVSEAEALQKAREHLFGKNDHATPDDTPDAPIFKLLEFLRFFHGNVVPEEVLRMYKDDVQK